MMNILYTHERGFYAEIVIFLRESAEAEQQKKL